MSVLSDLLVGKSEKTSARGTQTQMQKDLLNRAMVGQLVQPPNTAISVPMQQAVSSYQGMMPTLQQSATGSLAGRLSQPSGSGVPGAGVTGTGAGGASPDWTPAAGADQQGLQTRAQLGLPDRSSYFQFMPSAQQIADIGLGPVRPGGGPALQQSFQQQQKQQMQQAVQAARAANPPGPGRRQALPQARYNVRKAPLDIGGCHAVVRSIVRCRRRRRSRF